MSQASVIQIWGTVAVKPAFLVLAPQFERSTGHKLDVHWVLTVAMMNRLKGGETTDLVITTARNIEELVRAGVIEATSTIPLVKSAVGVAVRAGATKPDISNAAAVKAALLAAGSIAYSLGPSGVHLVALLERLGISEALRAKTRIVKGEPVGAVVARGEAQIGFQQMSELLPVSGIDLVGPLPADAQEISVFTAGVHVKSAIRQAAETLAKFIAAAAVLKQTGLEPLG
jgi:molybdate transport system substrate-binding protein